MNEKIFFTKNSEPERCKLFTTLRPSLTTFGIFEKSDSKSTTCEACTAASEPLAIATEQSASFSANTSFTPSPTIATVLPASFKMLMIRRFWSGVTRPSTVFSSTPFLKSTPEPSLVASTHFSAPKIPACFATSDTVSGLSPEMTFTCTPCSAKYLKVAGAVSRILFCSTMIPSGFTLAVKALSFIALSFAANFPLYWPNTNTR